MQRERQRVALTSIADQTKIKLSLLEGLERDDVSHWPEGIFRRSYVRAYAQLIGLEPGAVVREFLERYPDSVEVTPAALEAARNSRGETVNRRPSTRLGFLIDSAIGALPTLLLPRDQRRGLGIVNAAPADRGSSVDRKPSGGEPELSAAAHMNVTAADGSSSVECKSVPVEPALAAAARASLPAAPGSGSVRGKPVHTGHDLSAVAHLCTRLGRALAVRDVAPVLEDVARILDAVGLSLWLWHPPVSALRAVLAHGYSDQWLARLPVVRRDADNAIAAAFRSAETCIVNSGDVATGAVVVPLLTPGGCVGVLALELRHGGEQHESVRALTTILAAQLSMLFGSPPLVEAVSA
jgi:GAF domain-containing protein